MGAWDTGPFDNDHAADFTDDVINSAGPEARDELFMTAFRAVTDVPDGWFDSRCVPSFELPHEFEEVIASAAYLADEVIGTWKWSGNAYARRVVPHGSAQKTIEFLPLTPEILEAAHAALTRVLRIMELRGIEPQWREASWLILKDLESGRG
jgi:hypothetical protein